MRRLAGVKRKVRIGFSQCQNLPFLPVRKSVPASRRALSRPSGASRRGSLDGVARCEMLKAEGMAGNTSPFVLAALSRRSTVDRLDLTTRLPFALFFEPQSLGSVPVGFLSCESVLLAINRPSAEMRVGYFRLSQTRQRSHRSSVSILNLPAKLRSFLAELFGSSRRRFHRNSSQRFVHLLGDPDPVHQND
jgi:hypothetical protein